MNFYLNGQKISKAKAVELFGESTIAKRVKEAKETHAADPYTEISWMDGLLIEVK